MINKFTIVIANIYEEHTPITIGVTLNGEVDDIIVAQHVNKVLLGEGITIKFIDLLTAIKSTMVTNSSVIKLKYETHVVTKFDEIEDPSICTACLDLYPNDFFNVYYYTVGVDLITGDTENQLVFNLVDHLLGNTARGKSYFAVKLMIETFDHFMYNELEVIKHQARSVEDINKLYST